jgi:peptidyl-prolyl cis-trans isomerase C
MKRALWVVALGLGCQAHEGLEERPLIARVGGVPIYVDEFKREFRRIRLDDQEGLPPAGAEEAQKKALLDDLIERRLVLAEAERKNVIITSAEVDGMFARTRSGWQDDDFDALLRGKDVTPTELKTELRDLLLIRKYFSDHVFSRVAVTDREIDEHLEQHPEALLAPEAVRARHIVVKTQDEANKILQQLKGTLAFEDAAMSLSLSPDGKNGGDLGFFARGVMPSVFDEVCFSLPPGQISKVVASDYGFHIFKVIEKRPPHARPLGTVKEEIEVELRRAKERAAQHTKVEELKKAAIIDVREEQLARIH